MIKFTFSDKTYSIFLIVGAILTLGIIFFLVNSINISQQEKAAAFTFARIEENMKLQRQSMQEIFTNELKTIEILAESFYYIENQKNRAAILADYTKESGYDMILVSDTNGKAITGKNTVIDISKNEFFTAVMQTKRAYISNPQKSVFVPNETVIFLATPLMQDAKIIGIVAGAYNIKYITSFLRTTFNGQVFNMLIASDGTPIALPNISQLVLSGVEIEKLFNEGIITDKAGKKQNLNFLIQEMDNLREGLIHILYKKDSYDVLFTPFGINDWYILTFIPQEILYNDLKLSSWYRQLILFIVLVLVIVFAVYTSFSKLKIGKKIFLSFLAIVLIASSSGIVGSLMLTQTFKQYDFVYDNYNLGLADISDLILALNTNNIRMREFFMSETKEERIQIANLIEQEMLDAILLKNSLKVKMRSERATNIIDNAGKLLFDYRDVRNQIIDLLLIDDNNYNKAYEIWTTECMPKLDQITVLLERLTKLNINNTGIIISTQKIKASETQLFILFVVCFAVTFSLFIAKMISASINKPLKEIENAAIRIAKNDTDFEIKSITNDEIGIVANVLNTSVKNAFIKINKERDNLLEKINIDALTGIYNRHYIEISMIHSLQIAQKTGANMSVMMIDIDFFKKYNDTYGHQAGDECLVKVAHALDKNIGRSEDFVARYGGEEFIVVLPSTGADGAKIVADRLLNAIKKLKIPHVSSTVSPYVTVSIGVTSGSIHEQNAVMSDYIKKADEALYTAKQEGRNRYVFSAFEHFNFEVPEQSTNL